MHKSSLGTQILSQAQRWRSSRWPKKRKKKDPDILLQHPREEAERMCFLCSADRASAGRSVSAAARQVSGSAQDSGGSIQEQRSDMQLTVYSSLVTLTSSSCICTPMSLLWKRGGKKKNKQRDNEINDKIRKGIIAADVSVSPQRWSGKVTLQVDTDNEDCGTSGSVLIKTQ